MTSSDLTKQAAAFARRARPTASKSRIAPAAPLGGGEFAAIMRAVGPWEAAPHLAVAVSGGADSLALAHLAHEWADSRDGRVDALIVDHGLRPESALEAQQAAALLAAAGIPSHVLVWTGDKPGTGLQAAARRERYRLLAEWCALAGVLHLLTAHHAGDQAETVVLRATAGSGFHGLAAMAAVVEARAHRLVRPLLGVAEARLQATLAARGCAWIEDPSNADRRFTRVRVRQGLASTAATDPGFVEAARRIGAIRAFDESAVSALLARSAAVYPAGFAILDPQRLGAAPCEIAERALGRVLACIGGQQHPPSQASLSRLRRAVIDAAHPRARTLAGCRIIGWRGRLLVCREAGRGLPRIAVAPGEKVHWDGRFLVRWPSAGSHGVFLAAVGDGGRAKIGLDEGGPGSAKRSRGSAIPSPALASLPAFWNDRGFLAVPQLAHMRSATASATVGCAVFQPNQPFVPPHFAVASALFDPI